MNTTFDRLIDVLGYLALILMILGAGLTVCYLILLWIEEKLTDLVEKIIERSNKNHPRK